MKVTNKTKHDVNLKLLNLKKKEANLLNIILCVKIKELWKYVLLENLRIVT